MSQKKILVVFESHKVIRTFLETNSLAEINLKHDVNYAILNDLKKNKNITKIKKKLYYEYSNLNKKIAKLITRLFYYSNFTKSKSYKFRLKRHLNWHILYNKNIFFLKRYFHFLRVLISKKGLLHLFLLPIASMRIFRFYFYELILKYNKIPQNINKFLKKNKNHKIIIIVASTGIDFFTLLLDKIKKEYKNTKDIIMIDNWDNISSKGGFWHKPNALITWGTQSSNDAKKIFNIKSSNLYEFGTPSYKNYFINRYKKEKRLYDFKYILFSGPALPFDDLNALKVIDDILKNNHLFKNLKLIYRPHPMAQVRNSKFNFYNEKFNNIFLDNDSKNYYLKKKTQTFKTPLNYFPSLIKNSEFVIAPLTTLLIESLIFYKKVLVLLHNDDFHYETPRRVYDNMEHLKVLRNNSFLNYSYDFQDLKQVLVKTYKKRKSVNKKKIDLFLDKVIKNPKNFDKNILKLVNKL